MYLIHNQHLVFSECFLTARLQALKENSCCAEFELREVAHGAPLANLVAHLLAQRGTALLRDTTCDGDNSESPGLRAEKSNARVGPRPTYGWGARLAIRRGDVLFRIPHFRPGVALKFSFVKTVCKGCNATAYARPSRENSGATPPRLRSFRAVPALYFPHSADFRGRVYPVPPPLNHQVQRLAALHPRVAFGIFLCS